METFMKAIKKILICSLVVLFATHLNAGKKVTFTFGNNDTKTIKTTDFHQLFPGATSQTNDSPIRLEIPMTNEEAPSSCSSLSSSLSSSKKVHVHYYKRNKKKNVFYFGGLPGSFEGAKYMARTIFKDYDVAIVRYGWQNPNDDNGLFAALTSNLLSNSSPNPVKISENFFNGSTQEVKAVLNHFKKEKKHDEYIGFFNSYGNFPGLSNQDSFDKIISCVCWHKAKETSKKMGLLKLISPLISANISTEPLLKKVRCKGGILMFSGKDDILTSPQTSNLLYQAVPVQTKKTSIMLPDEHNLDFIRLNSVINLFIDAKKHKDFQDLLKAIIV